MEAAEGENQPPKRMRKLKEAGCVVGPIEGNLGFCSRCLLQLSWAACVAAERYSHDGHRIGLAGWHLQRRGAET
jgi:hypothetical protein